MVKKFQEKEKLNVQLRKTVKDLKARITEMEVQETVREASKLKTDQSPEAKVESSSEESEKSDVEINPEIEQFEDEVPNRNVGTLLIDTPETREVQPESEVTYVGTTLNINLSGSQSPVKKADMPVKDTKEEAMNKDIQIETMTEKPESVSSR